MKSILRPVSDTQTAGRVSASVHIHGWCRIAVLIAIAAATLPAQPYDLVLRGGHVIDPANNIDGVLDVAITGGRIAAIQPSIPTQQARQSIDVAGLYVVPGLVDLHAHVFGYPGSLFPDDTSLVTGATTIVDAGGSGWRTIDEFRRTVMAQAKTRVLALMNIVGRGMVGGPAESDTSDMDSEKTAAAIMRNRDVVVGIKTAHFALPGWTAIDRAVAAGRIANVPVMVDDRILTGVGRTTREELLEHLRPGDIHTHMYNDRQVELLNRATGKVQPYMLEARRRGVLFDLGHGAGSFLWPVATRASAQGFWPDTISTDLHDQSILGAQPDMPNCISKMMLLGMPLKEAIFRSTVTPAKEIHRYPEIGTLNHGAIADVAVLSLDHGVFAFKDAWGMKRLGTERLQCAMTVRAGKIVFDRDGRQSPDWTGGAPDRGTPSGRIYDLLLKNGHLIDPANHRDGRFDVAIAAGKVVTVGHDLPASHARVVIEAGQYYVTPGLIDLRAHLENLLADHNSLPYGVTTAVDAGSANWKTFDEFQKKRIVPAKTRVLVFLRLDSDADSEATNRILQQHPQVVVGLAQNHCGSPQGFPGTPVLVDAPCGGQQGILAGVVSTGISRANVMAQTNMMTALSKLLNQGMSLDQIVERTTVNPARAIRRPELGTLGEGAPADVALLELQEGKSKKLRCVLTLRDGAVVWDSEGLSRPDWIQAGPYSNFK